MSRTPADFKERLARRSAELAKTRSTAPEPELAPEEEVAVEDKTEDMEDVTIGDEDVVDLSLEEVYMDAEIAEEIGQIEDAGYTDYISGVDLSDNPYLLEEEEEEPDAGGESQLYAEAWAEGWYSANIQACMTSLLIYSKALVEADTSEDAEAAFDNLKEAVEVTVESVDMEATQRFWEAVLEGVSS